MRRRCGSTPRYASGNAGATTVVRPDSDPGGEEVLTARQAFLVMSDFIWEFGQRAGDDLIILIGGTVIEADGKPTDPAAWDDGWRV